MENSNLLACVEQELRRSTYRRGRPPCLPVFRGLFGLGMAGSLQCGGQTRGSAPTRGARLSPSILENDTADGTESNDTADGTESACKASTSQPRRRPGRWGDTKGNCALQGQNRQTCPKDAAPAGRLCHLLYYSPKKLRVDS